MENKWGSNQSSYIRTVITRPLDEAEVKDVDINQGIESTLLILSHRFDKQQIQIKKQYGNLPNVECYPAQLNQVFMNIIGNAIDACIPDSKNNQQITITTEAIGNKQIQIKIKDNGSGMSQSVIDKMFDPFFTTKPIGKGTGLGLSICYQIIEKHKGSIRVISQPGEGTEFILTLPSYNAEWGGVKTKY